MRRAALLVLAILALGAVAAAAGTDPRSETVRLRPADIALAKRELLRATDLGPDWKRISVPSNEDNSFSCPGFRPDFSAFTITGKAKSAFRYQSPPGAQIFSAAEVFKTRAQAATDFRLGAKPALAPCLRNELEKSFRAAGPGIAARVLSSRMVAAPRVGERSAAYRLAARISVNGISLGVRVDLVAFQRGRSIAVLSFTGIGSPVPSQASYARLVASRMR